MRCAVRFVSLRNADTIVWMLYTAASGCRASVVKTDTLYKARTSADTFRLHDSVYVEHYTRGDTVYSQKSVWRWRDRISVKTDTIYKAMLQTDTTRLPIPVERKLSTWERTQMRVGQFTIGAVVLVVLSLLLWLIHRRR